MDRALYYDRSGAAISAAQWVQLTDRERFAEMCRVARTELAGGVIVSTVWVGIDMSVVPGSRPVIFETMVFGGPHNEDCWRWSTEQEAREGHESVVSLVRTAEDV